MARPAPPALAFQDDGALLGPDTGRRDRLLDQIKASGARDVRANVIWGQIRKNGGYDWTALDAAVNAERARGLHPQFSIFGTPRYMTGADQTLSWQNNNPTVMQTFAKDVAQHFRGRVGRYSIGNEPNWDSFNQGARDNPQAAGRTYRKLYQGGYAGIKAADPSAQVLLGEVTSTPGAKAFVQSLMAGKPLRAAGFAYHPYDQPGVPTESWDVDNLKALQGTLAAYKRSGQLQTNQGKAVPLYLTEFGTPTSRGTAAQRAALFARAYRLAGQAGARQLLQYQVAPNPTDATWDTSLAPAAVGGAVRSVRGARVAQVRPIARRR